MGGKLEVDKKSKKSKKKEKNKDRSKKDRKKNNDGNQRKMEIMMMKQTVKRNGGCMLLKQGNLKR